MLDTKNPLAPITVGSGFIVTVNPANVLNNGVPINIPSTIVSLTPSATNFIHITSGGSLTVNTSGFPAGCLPIAQVTCSSTSVTGIVDSRPDFYLASSSSSSSAPSFQLWGGLASVLSVGALSLANKIQITGFLLPYGLTFSKMNFNVINANGADLNDIGVYDSSGNLKAHTGATVLSSINDQSLPVLGAPVTLVAGTYFIAFTSNNVNVQLAKAGGAVQTQLVTPFATAESATTSSGGVLPSSIAAPTIAFSQVTAVVACTLHS